MARNILNELGDKSPLKILAKYLQEGNTFYAFTCESGALPCSVQSLSVTENAEVSEFPADDNTTFSDNVIFLAKSVSCNLFVLYDDLDNFRRILREGNVSEGGFAIATISDSFINMRYLESSYSEDSNSTNGVFVNITFRETKLVEAKSGYLDYRKVKKPTSASVVKSGKVEAKPVKDKTTALNIVNEIKKSFNF
ncbi:hypothetical protein CQA53_08970 [Helicobacter didelphidarum]|uniref:Uncharacterized protein n=1 Tax=Helicobacter didelphidarum TaxID=2040648 RepID=A0A3D8ICE0_9HELI|nr:hypothetical protein [Helicobacter didelphidarum]RDU62829.1 hypothetical protein CQA53_08970 [Helicobacter didelphidarum]